MWKGEMIFWCKRMLVLGSSPVKTTWDTHSISRVGDDHQCKLMGQSLPDIYTVIAKSYIKKAALEWWVRICLRTVHVPSNKVVICFISFIFNLFVTVSWGIGCCPTSNNEGLCSSYREVSWKTHVKREVRPCFFPVSLPRTCRSSGRRLDWS